MECFIVLPSDVDIERHELILRGEEAHHAIRSLRLHAGDAVLATNLIGMCYRCRVEHSSAGSLTCSIEELLPEFGESARDVALIASLIAQPARWEFLLEKATELGARAIQPVYTERTERSKFRRERSEKILRAAVKQTKRARMPMLQDVMELHKALAKAQTEGRAIFLLHEAALLEDSLARHLSEIGNQQIAIVIGPEGGFSDAEIAMAREEFGACIASLGPRRLRAETAAMAALSVIMASN